MKLFIAFVVFKLLVDDVILALVIYALKKQREINQEAIEMYIRHGKAIDRIDRTIDREIRLERLERERKRMYNPCNYGGHDWEGDGETVVKNVCGDCKHYYNYVCKRCGKKKTTTKPVISRWEDEE
jgi:hypothetical protein